MIFLVASANLKKTIPLDIWGKQKSETSFLEASLMNNCNIIQANTCDI
jgi:hypothetical protein